MSTVNNVPQEGLNSLNLAATGSEEAPAVVSTAQAVLNTGGWYSSITRRV